MTEEGWIFHPSVAPAIRSYMDCPFARLALAQTCRAGQKWYRRDADLKTWRQFGDDCDLMRAGGVLHAWLRDSRIFLPGQHKLYDDDANDNDTICIQWIESIRLNEPSGFLYKFQYHSGTVSDNKMGHIPQDFILNCLCPCGGNHNYHANYAHARVTYELIRDVWERQVWIIWRRRRRRRIKL